ncbi:MAG: NAD(P)H-dependent oxidoreductase [Pseudomonadota bacterium]
MATYRIVGLSGALRASSTNTKLLKEAARLFGDCEFSQANLKLPLYDGDHEAAAGVPGEVQALADVIAAADGVLISTPEYNKGPSGALKNALDWISRTKSNPWKGKPVAVMSAAAGRAGGERAQLVLRSFMVPFQPRILQGPELHLADSANQFNDDGQLTAELYVQTLSQLMENLRREIELVGWNR